MHADCWCSFEPLIRFPSYRIMDAEYRLAWANIEGWTTNKRGIYLPRRGKLSDFRSASAEKSESPSVNS
jgi:hypothetical protein